MTRERAVLEAQRAANRAQRPMALLNLNRVGLALYVVREPHPAMLNDPQLVLIAHPGTIDQGG